MVLWCWPLLAQQSFNYSIYNATPSTGLLERKHLRTCWWVTTTSRRPDMSEYFSKQRNWIWLSHLLGDLQVRRLDIVHGQCPWTMSPTTIVFFFLKSVWYIKIYKLNKFQSFNSHLNLLIFCASINIYDLILFGFLRQFLVSFMVHALYL